MKKADARSGSICGRRRNTKKRRRREMKIRATCFRSTHGATVKYRLIIRKYRISVVGTSGSGKTTFANKLAGILRIPHVELDALHWESDWVEAPRDVFRSRVREAVQADRWVVDGNYSKGRLTIRLHSPREADRWLTRLASARD